MAEEKTSVVVTHSCRVEGKPVKVSDNPQSFPAVVARQLVAAGRAKPPKKAQEKDGKK